MAGIDPAADWGLPGHALPEGQIDFALRAGGEGNTGELIVERLRADGGGVHVDAHGRSDFGGHGDAVVHATVASLAGIGRAGVQLPNVDELDGRIAARRHARARRATGRALEARVHGERLWVRHDKMKATAQTFAATATIGPGRPMRVRARGARPRRRRRASRQAHAAADHAGAHAGADDGRAARCASASPARRRCPTAPTRASPRARRSARRRSTPRSRRCRSRAASGTSCSPSRRTCSVTGTADDAAPRRQRRRRAPRASRCASAATSSPPTPPSTRLRSPAPGGWLGVALGGARARLLARSRSTSG